MIGGHIGQICNGEAMAFLRDLSYGRQANHRGIKHAKDMQPLQDLLHRIMWDPEFGMGRFAIGYEDRLMSHEMVVPFAAVRLDSDRPGMLSVQQEDGSLADIPLHRVRTVYKDGEVIWRRRGRGPRD